MFSNLLQSLEPAREYRCGRHPEPALPGPPLPARGGLSFTDKRVSAAQLESKFKHLKQERLDAPLERLVDFPKEMVPGEETRRSKRVQGQPGLASSHSLSK